MAGCSTDVVWLVGVLVVVVVVEGQMVKGQGHGHGGIKYAGDSSFSAC